VHWQKHPHARTKRILDIEQEIFLAAVDQGVLICRGSWFLGEKITDLEPTDMFFRATYAAASEDKIFHAIERFGIAVRQSFGVK
jgi:aromatic amino acid aminotransferase I / 2-aminoadipate transaminase